MRLFSLCSARPNFVKLAAVHHAVSTNGDIEHIIIHTGQHHDPLFSDIFFRELQIPLPQVNLGIHGGTNEEQQRRVEESCATLFASERPDIVLVYGDVNGAAAAARAASHAGVRIGHVEAGLRSFDASMPEEVNRIAIDRVSDFLFATEQSGVDHLREENVNGRIHLVGNTMIDTLIRMLPAIGRVALPSDLPDRYAVVTLHRPGNVDQEEMLRSFVDFLVELSEHISLVFPLHLRTKQRLMEFDLYDRLIEHVLLLAPLPYLPFLRLVMDAHFVLTDSGGIQEETTYLRKKCFTARPNTERPVTIELGSNELVDLSKEDDRHRIVMYAGQESEPVGEIPPLWDGKAGERIVRILDQVLS